MFEGGEIKIIPVARHKAEIVIVGIKLVRDVRCIGNCNVVVFLPAVILVSKYADQFTCIAQ